MSCCTSAGIATAALREARIKIDRMTIDAARREAKIGHLEQENEALRDMVATIALGGKQVAL